MPILPCGREGCSTLVTDKAIYVIQQWVQKAENDFITAVHTLKLGRNCPTDTVCFHAQQCVEKYLKSLMVFKNQEILKTHDIRVLMNLLPRKLQPNLSKKEQDDLTDYAVFTRYPGDYEPITLTQAREAVAIAKRVRKQVRALLPPASLKLKPK